ncbi:MAG: nitrilase-related carbon-nitrogen hydrolase [Planctomycetota bacterium]
MTSETAFYAACCQVDQPNPLNRSEMRRNTDRMLAMMEQAVSGYRPFHDVRLVVFPEFAHAAPVYATSEELAEKLALPAENEHIERLSAQAKKLGCFLQTGSFLEVDPRWPDAVFNTTLLISPQGERLSRYRKTNPWIPWEVHASPHDLEGYDEDPFPVVDTEIGRLGVATCYDWLFPEVTRELALRGCEVMIRISAYMDPWGSTEPMDWWTLINRTRAIENQAYVVACNQGAQLTHYPPFSWPGGSMVVDYDGRILAQASPGPGERIVVAPVDVTALRRERKRREGHAMTAHLRSELYQRSKTRVFPPQPKVGERTPDGFSKSIRETKKRIGFCTFGENDV